MVYIDPPFDVGADFSFDIEVGDGEQLTKQPTVIEELALEILGFWIRFVSPWL